MQHSRARIWWGSGVRSALSPGRLVLPVTLRDVGLFAFSARTDVTIARLSATRGARTVFETVYARWDDPWRSASPYYRYQRRKYEQVIQLLPRDRFGRALDLGCSLGLLAPMLAPRVEEFLGLDIAEGAINRARERSAHLPNVHFEQSDMLHLPKDLNGRFDLVLVLDVLYYLLPLDAELLKQLAERTADLLVPGGLCVLGACRGVSIGRSKTLRTSVSSPSTAGPSSWSVSSRLLPVQHFRNITHFPKLLRDANRDHWPCNLFFCKQGSSQFTCHSW